MNVNEATWFLSRGGWGVIVHSARESEPHTCHVDITHREHGTYNGKGRDTLEALSDAMTKALWVIGGK